MKQQTFAAVTGFERHSRKTQARFCCVECGFEENVDQVGAINILRGDTASSPVERRRSQAT
jgi:transposase